MKKAQPKAAKATVGPSGDFDVLKDCEWIMKAMKGFGTNHETLTTILTKRSSRQRVQIKREYQKVYKLDLMEEFNGELSGDYLKTMLNLLKGRFEFDAQCLNEAIKQKEKGVSILVEILCTRSYSELQTIFDNYQQQFDESVDTFIEANFSGNLQRFILALANQAAPSKSNSNDGDEKVKIIEGATTLYDALKGGVSDLEKLIDVFSSHDHIRLRSIFFEYEDMFESDLEPVISDCLKDDDTLKKALVGAGKLLMLSFANQS